MRNNHQKWADISKIFPVKNKKPPITTHHHFHVKSMTMTGATKTITEIKSQMSWNPTNCSTLSLFWKATKTPNCWLLSHEDVCSSRLVGDKIKVHYSETEGQSSERNLHEHEPWSSMSLHSFITYVLYGNFAIHLKYWHCVIYIEKRPINSNKNPPFIILWKSFFYMFFRYLVNFSNCLISKNPYGLCMTSI